MLVIPAIDLKNGKCVRLIQGQADQETIYGDDPVAVARRFAADGARMLHLVDLDGAFNDLTLRLGAPRSDTRVDLDGAFNHLELVVPENTPVRVSSDGFINLVDRRANARTLNGPAYRLRPEGAFNRVVIRSQ